MAPERVTEHALLLIATICCGSLFNAQAYSFNQTIDTATQQPGTRLKKSRRSGRAEGRHIKTGLSAFQAVPGHSNLTSARFVRRFLSTHTSLTGGRNIFAATEMCLFTVRRLLH